MAFNIRNTAVTVIHKKTPKTVGSRMESAVHFHEPVSFLIVRTVVEQGQ